MTTTAPVNDGSGEVTQSITQPVDDKPETITTTETATIEQVPASTSSQSQQTPTPTQHPPPSPLSGCYLLVVLPEPHCAQHKDLILSRLAKG